MLVLLFAVIGAVASWNFFAGPAGVGHFRSADGRAEYAAAYGEVLDEPPEPTAEHDVQTSHGTVRVYEWATEQNRDQAPVLLVPGRATGMPMWSENLPALVQQRRVLAFDSLGDSGMSEQSVPFASFAEQAGPVDQVVDQLAPDGVHVVGHSFGGAVATSFARQHPEDVITLTLLDPALTFATPPLDLLWWATVGTLPWFPDGVREHALAKVGGVEPEPGQLQQDAMGRMIAAAGEHYSAAVPTPSPLDDEQLEQLSMPVYVAIASDDSLAGGQAAADRAAQLPRPTVVTWPETTHSLPMQAAGELEPELLEFFAAHEER